VVYRLHLSAVLHPLLYLLNPTIYDITTTKGTKDLTLLKVPYLEIFISESNNDNLFSYWRDKETLFVTLLQKDFVISRV
jgi:hypothetical protein